MDVLDSCVASIAPYVEEALDHKKLHDKAARMIYHSMDDIDPAEAAVARIRLDAAKFVYGITYKADETRFKQQAASPIHQRHAEYFAAKAARDAKLRGQDPE